MERLFEEVKRRSPKMAAAFRTTPFFVYADEFQNFSTADFGRLFAEARKFNIALTISHQTLSQIPQSIKDICLQAGMIIVFRVSSEDAEALAGNFDATPPEPEIEIEEEPWGEEEIKTPVKDVVHHFGVR